MDRREDMPIVALIYDFDGTLSYGNMQEYSFMERIGVNKDEFWNETAIMAEKQDADNILIYMLLMLQKAKAKGMPIRRDDFIQFGEGVKLCEGVNEWFENINEFGKKHGVKIEHFINSSGMKEIIEGTPIAKEFKQIFASCYYYDDQGNAIWPAAAVNYTNKTQFLFKINKGIDSIRDSIIINDSMPEEEKRVHFTNMIYLGDGETDVPCMKLIKQLGGTAIAVFEPENDKKRDCAKKLLTQKRVDYICPAIYSKGDNLDKLVKSIICKIKADEDLREIKKLFNQEF